MKRVRFILLLLLSIHNGLPAQTIRQWDIVINELLPDPSPPQGLPNSEFIELKNVSANSINLRNWKISDGTSTATISSNIILAKDSFLILCPSSAASGFLLFGQALGIANFPSLNNDADIISLYAPDGKLIHCVGYTIDWFQTSIKSQGGWSLEMIDPHNPCGEFSNWKPSEHKAGGSPGQQNSVAGSNADEQLPSLLRTYTLDPSSIVAVFDESLDSSALNTSQFTLEGYVVKSVLPIAPLYKEVKILLNQNLVENAPVQLTVRNVLDCVGNPIGAINQSKAGLPSIPDTSDIIINEILFNPAPDGYDYIELFNRSNKIIDLKQLSLANTTNTGSLNNQVTIQPRNWLFFPGEYIVVSANPSWVAQQYTVKNKAAILLLSDMISLPDDKGQFVLLAQNGTRIDEIIYQQQWHFPLLNEKEGVSLERISDKNPTQDPSNWTSASGDAGFGTPGYANSQQLNSVSIKGSVDIIPKVFTPNFDGQDDFAFIRYQLDQPGYIATVIIYDSYGRSVKTLVYNQTVSSKGQWRWDGLNDLSYPQGAGMYIVMIDLFDLKGRRKKMKYPLVLARPNK